MVKFKGNTCIYPYMDILNYSCIQGGNMNRNDMSCLLKRTDRPQEMQQVFMQSLREYLSEFVVKKDDRAFICNQLFPIQVDSPIDSMDTVIHSMVLAGQRLDNPFLQKRIHKKIKNKFQSMLEDTLNLRIPFQCVDLIGEIDESETLKEDEIYVPCEKLIQDLGLPLTYEGDFTKFKLIKYPQKKSYTIPNIVNLFHDIPISKIDYDEGKKTAVAHSTPTIHDCIQANIKAFSNKNSHTGLLYYHATVLRSNSHPSNLELRRRVCVAHAESIDATKSDAPPSDYRKLYQEIEKLKLKKPEWLEMKGKMQLKNLSQIMTQWQQTNSFECEMIKIVLEQYNLLKMRKRPYNMILDPDLNDVWKEKKATALQVPKLSPTSVLMQLDDA
ncbi:hypothetical protein C9374_002595 [Naegleria lovaniensis]|uniref:RNA-dependent RNA polymerase n=1 Tax=Naegleria lovaniensis TaxID=51637 RepID=A0AA88GUV8_NAELO|nr:hypothetical protein C9374_002595 [Naegleria lovaniensis]